MGLIKRFQRAASAPTTSAPSVPPGTVIWQAGNAAPNGYLKANGATVSRAVYADLFAAIGTIYGAGDGSTTFAIPDLRGEFIRGWDDGRGVDAGRVLGSSQGQDWKSFSMTNTSQNNFDYSHGPVFMGKSSTSFIGKLFTGYYNGPATAIGTKWDDTEVRPRNIALLACIKF